TGASRRLGLHANQILLAASRLLRTLLRRRRAFRTIGAGGLRRRGVASASLLKLPLELLLQPDLLLLRLQLLLPQALDLGDLLLFRRSQVVVPQLSEEVLQNLVDRHVHRRKLGGAQVRVLGLLRLAALLIRL